MKGFSLIELMVVIAIVAILSAVAAPAYKKYIVQANAAAAIGVAASIKSKAIEFYNANGFWPDAKQLGFTTDTGAYGDTILTSPETELGDIISPLSAGGSYIQPVSITSPCNASYEEIRLVIEAQSDGPFVRGVINGYFRLGADADGIIIHQCSDDDDSANEENLYYNNCKYLQKADFEAALCS